jgi:hypothetical protein
MFISSVSFVTTLVSAFVALGLAAYVLRCNRRASANHWLALGLFVIAGHQALVFVSRFAPSESWHIALLRSAFGVAMALPPIWLGFSLTFGEKSGGVHASHRYPILPCVALAAFVASILLVLGRGIQLVTVSRTGHTVVSLDGWGQLLFSVYLVSLVLVRMSADFARDRLFRPFQTTKSRGLGIGLFQCRHIVQALGGELAVDSHEGVGTCMTVRSPTAK